MLKIAMSQMNGDVCASCFLHLTLPPVTKRTNSMKYSVSRGLNKVCVSRGLKAQQVHSPARHPGRCPGLWTCWAFSPLWLMRCKKIRSALPLALARMLNEKVPNAPHISLFSINYSGKVASEVNGEQYDTVKYADFYSPLWECVTQQYQATIG